MKATRGWAVAAVVMMAALLRSMAEGIGLSDESWYLQVVARVHGGAVLYRDVAFGMTPLSLYLTEAVTWVTGVDVLAVKLVTNLAFAVTTWLTWRLACEIRGTEAAAIAAAAVLLFGRPYANPPYTPVAMACFMATLAAVLSASRSEPTPRRRRDLTAGVLTGLAFLAKQNVGPLALAAAALGMAWTTPAPAAIRIRRIARMAGVALLTVGVGLVPVWASGGLPMLLDYGFLGKGAYLVFGRVSYLTGLGTWLAAAPPPWSGTSVGELVRGLVLILPIAVGVAAVMTWRSRRLDDVDRIVLAFAAAGTLVAFPRWNRFHMAYALAPLALALVSFLRPRPGRPSTPHGRRLRAVLAGALPASAVAVLLPVVLAASRGARPSHLSHFHGALTGPAEDAILQGWADRLKAAGDGAPVFVLDSRAGFLYLASGLRNPTPYDLPAFASLGTRGGARLIDQLASGALPEVCVGHDPAGQHYVGPGVRFVTSHFYAGPDLGLCRLYHAPARPPEGQS